MVKILLLIIFIFSKNYSSISDLLAVIPILFQFTHNEMAERLIKQGNYSVQCQIKLG